MDLSGTSDVLAGEKRAGSTCNVPRLDSSCSSRNREALITAPAIQNICDYLCKKADERQT